jgi:hypothetical protein
LYITKFLFLIVVLPLAVSSGSAFAGCKYEKDEAAKLKISGVYAFQPYHYVRVDDTEKLVPEVLKPDYLVLLMNVNSHKCQRSYSDLFSTDAKYTIFVSASDDLSVTFEINVFFGEGTQYAFFVNNKSNPILGKIGEYTSLNDVTVFAGERDNPNVFDKDGFLGMLANVCLPVTGFRCDGSGEPKNFYMDTNVASIAVELPIKRLTGLMTSNEGKIKVWAKVFSRD